MTIDGWRKGRDDKGWQLPRSQTIIWKKEEQDWSNEDICIEDDIPTEVSAVPHFKDDVNALQSLCGLEEPVLKRVRCNSV